MVPVRYVYARYKWIPVSSVHTQGPYFGPSTKKHENLQKAILATILGGSLNPKPLTLYL